MHCGHCRQPIPHALNVEAPCPRCGGEVLAEGRWLLLSAWGEGFEAVDLSTGARSTWPEAPAASAQPADPTDDEVALDELLAASFPALPAMASVPAGAEAADEGAVEVVPRPALRQRLVRRASVLGVSVTLAAQLGFATAPAPKDYAHAAHATPGHEHLIGQVRADPGVQRCLSGHRALPRAQAEAPALLQLAVDPWATPRTRVSSVNPVLVGCLMEAAGRLGLPEGRYDLAVPITEPG